MSRARVAYPPSVAGGDDITINTTAVTDANFNDTTPAAAAGRALAEWQRSGSGPDSVSAQIPTTVGMTLDQEVTDLDVSNTVTETTIFTHSVPANVMSTNRMLHLVMVCDYLNNGATTDTLTIRLKFGGTVAYQDSVDVSAINAQRRPLYMEFWLANQDATNDQIGGGIIFLGVIGGADIGIGDTFSFEIESSTPLVTADLAIDSTAAKALDVTAQWDVTKTTVSLKRRFAILEII